MYTLCFAPALAVPTVHSSLQQAVSTRSLSLPKRAASRAVFMSWGPNINEPCFTDWENQGCDLAFSKISGEGDIDIVKLAIDAPHERNQGYYRLVRGVRRQGDADYYIGCWGERIPVPGWFSWENQGAGVAIMDTGSEKNIVVAMMDNPQQSNTVFYKIGYRLDEHGYPTRGWTDFIAVPGDFGWETQGLGIDVASISSQSSQDLFVLYIDNPKEKNAAYYRVGYDIGLYGRAKEWSERFEVPNWFSWENQGAGVAVYDTNQNGKQDIVVFFIDNPVGKNEGYYIVGRDLDSKGKVTGGWSDLKQIPDWFSYENQGGGIAIHKFSGAAPTLATYFIDNPRGRNAAFLKFGEGVF